MATLKSCLRACISICLSIILVGGTATTFLGIWAYFTGDAVDRAEIDALLTFTLYEHGLKSDQDLYNYLELPRAEAPQHQVMRLLVSRAASNPNQFRRFIEHVAQRAERKFVQRLQVAVFDSSERLEFEKSFELPQ